MRYTAMMWMRRANMAALGGGADIMPDDYDPVDSREEWAEMHGYMRYRCPDCHRSFHSDSGPHCPYCPELEDTEGDTTPGEFSDPLTDEPFEKENNI